MEWLQVSRFGCAGARVRGLDTGPESWDGVAQALSIGPLEWFEAAPFARAGASTEWFRLLKNSVPFCEVWWAASGGGLAADGRALSQACREAHAWA